MERHPKTELRFVATALLIVAGGLLVMIVYVVPSYREIFGQPWQKGFATERDFEFHRTSYRQLLFVLLPLISVLHVWAAIKLFRCANRIPSTSANNRSATNPR